MGIKAVITDIDGTLLSHSIMAIPESALKAIDKLHEQGIMLILCSGRSYKYIKQANFINRIKPDAYITMNGAQILIDNKIVYKNPVNADDINLLISFSVKNNYSLALNEENKGSINMLTKEAHEAVTRCGIKFDDPVTYPYPFTNEVYQAVLFLNEEQEKELIPQLKSSKICRWDEYGIDIMDIETDKGHGVLALLQILGLKKEEVICLGDHNNDLDMLKAVPHSVAMGNAQDSCKEIAAYVTTDINEDGWANALKHFGVI